MLGARYYGYVVGLLFLGMACAPPGEFERAPRPLLAPAGLALAPPADEVHTVQLYAGREDALPILRLGAGPPLTLKFDLIGQAGHPLSIYFFHADREWRRDLTRSEYLAGFHSDDLFDYYLSNGTQVDYVHYYYTFPNSNTDFLISGNYLLRVSERGDEDAVLFERPFYVVEDTGPVAMDVQRLLVGGRAPSAIQPSARFTPLPQFSGNVFDFHVCFIRNGQHARPRCSQRPSLSMSPDLLFYLEPEESFMSQEGDFYLDLRWIRPGGQVERVDFSTLPHGVVLQPDYASFPLSGEASLSSGQSIISSARTHGGEPDVQGEYVEVLFRYVPPDEARLPGAVYIVSSFSGWQIDLSQPLRWHPEEKRYEGTMLVKQGEHEYRYTSPDPRVRRALSVRFPRETSQYTALVYYRDVLHNTDRLIGFQNAFAR